MNESLTVAPKLTPDQLAVLSLIFLFKYTINQGIRNQEMLWDYFDRYVSPLAPLINPKAACYQHLEYSDCGTVGLGSVELGDILCKKYGGLFSKGFENSQREAKQLSIPELHEIFRTCVNDSSRLQVNALTEEVVRSECTRLGISDDDATKLVALHNETLMTPREVAQHVVKSRDYMQGVFDVWSKSSMSQFTLTSVGIAIGHANLKKSVGEFTDLSIWIN